MFVGDFVGVFVGEGHAFEQGVCISLLAQTPCRNNSYCILPVIILTYIYRIHKIHFLTRLFHVASQIMFVWGYVWLV